MFHRKSEKQRDAVRRYPSKKAYIFIYYSYSKIEKKWKAFPAHTKKNEVEIDLLFEICVTWELKIGTHRGKELSNFMLQSSLLSKEIWEHGN